MTAVDILNEISRRGIKIELAGENIRLHGHEKDFDESLVKSIKTHKSKIIDILSGGSAANKGRPIWCTECQHGSYKTEDTGQALWCNLANQAVIDMQKCALGYWAKNEKGWPVTVH